MRIKNMYHLPIMEIKDDSWVSPVLQCGLGNRLFQFAAAAGTAERWGLPLVFYLPACMRTDHGSVATLFRIFPSVPVLSDWSPASKLHRILTIREPNNGCYTYMPFAEKGTDPPPGASILVDGFRQSYKYFPTEGSDTLKPDWDNAIGGKAIRSALESELGLETQEARRSTVAIHIRLGDFKNLPHHQIPLDKYYTKALAKVPLTHRIILFSDEPHLCQALLSGLPHTVLVARARADIETLYQMSLCLGGTIAANSTFSWWAAWFAHKEGAAWATFPDEWNKCVPMSPDFFPLWATVIPVKDDR
jgi:hypothetical protein